MPETVLSKFKCRIGDPKAMLKAMVDQSNYKGGEFMGDRHERTNKAMSKARMQSWTATSRTERPCSRQWDKTGCSPDPEFGVFSTCTL